MYEKDGEKYFIFDSHLHFWDASPANWVKGAEEYAKGWIECFHAYQGLGPAETHWTLSISSSLFIYSGDALSLEHFQKYSVETSRRTSSPTATSTRPSSSRRT